MADIILKNSIDSLKGSMETKFNTVIANIGGSTSSTFVKAEYSVARETETTHTFAAGTTKAYITNKDCYCSVLVKVNASTDYTEIMPKSTICLTGSLTSLSMKSNLTVCKVLIETGLIDRECKQTDVKAVITPVELSQYIVLSARKNKILYGKTSIVYLSTDGGKTATQVLATGVVGSYVSRGKIADDNENNMIIFMNTGEIFVSTDGGTTWVQSNTSGFTDVLPPYLNSCCWKDSVIVFAEYGTTSGRSYRVFKSGDNGVTWSVVLTKANPAEIRHFHTVDYMKYTGKWIITSGDENNQVRWFISTDNCATFTEVTGINGTEIAQRYRTVRIVEIAPNEIMWGADAVSRIAEICRAKLDDVVGTTVVLTDLNKTIFGIHKNGQDIIACTSTETTDCQDALTTLYLSRDCGKTWDRIIESKSSASAGGFRGCVGITENGEFVISLLKLTGAENTFSVLVKPN